MASGRAGGYTKCPSLTIVSLGKLLLGEEVFTLREYSPYVEYKVDVEARQRPKLKARARERQRRVVGHTRDFGNPRLGSVVGRD